MTTPKRIYKWYLILSIIYSILIIFGTYNTINLPVMITETLGFYLPWISGIRITFNMVIFLVFAIKGIEKIGLWISGVYGYSIYIFQLINLIINVTGRQPELEWNQLNHQIQFGIIPIITLILTIKLLMRKKT